MTNYNWQTVTSFLNGFRDRDILLGFFHFDGFWMKSYQWCDLEFDSEMFPDAANCLRRLKDRALLISRTDGSVWQWDYWQTGMAIVDFTNLDACGWFSSHLRRLMDMGVASQSASHTETSNTTTASTLTGPGGQAFPIHWGGDCESAYQAVAEAFPGGLSLMLSGSNSVSSHPIHGSTGSLRCGSPGSMVKTVSCSSTPSTGKILLMPYILTEALLAYSQGNELMRPMFLEFPEDLNTYPLDTQYMFGRDLLVAPVFLDEGTVTFYVAPHSGGRRGWKCREMGLVAPQDDALDGLELLVNESLTAEAIWAGSVFADDANVKVTWVGY
ncbi:hypothetical protein EYZ11_000989 [Aspergillus tanneri]|uniref:Uncharacterized protein n=1 Tax=Aspergillus tanneri TaxID=1220188 RepID=A0A4S3JVQ3_9EURO|nr:hypothetical protein EYZ11_000989 [Aspergillus tanneri]